MATARPSPFWAASRRRMYSGHWSISCGKIPSHLTSHGSKRTTPGAHASDEQRLRGPRGRRCKASTILDRQHGNCHRGSTPCTTGVSGQWKHAPFHAPQAEGSPHEKKLGLGHLQPTAQETTRTEARATNRGSQNPNQLSRHPPLTCMNWSSMTGPFSRVIA